MTRPLIPAFTEEGLLYRSAVPKSPTMPFGERLTN